MMFARTPHEAITKLRKQAHRFAARIAPLYRKLNWSWGSLTPVRIPTQQDIVESLNDRINDLEHVIGERGIHGSYSIESGGLKVGFRVDEEGQHEFYITFSDSIHVWGFMEDK